MAWLTDRLTSAKKASAMWQGLSDAISQTFSWRLSDIDSTLQKNRSYLTMSDEEINIVQRELGSFFSVMDVDREKGLALIHRLDQIHLKETDFAITDMIERSFDDVNITWSKLYSPVDVATTPYGQSFLADDEYKELSQQDKESYFLTSRGRIVLTLNTFMPEQSEMDRMYDLIQSKIVPLIPLTTVFDGFFTKVLITIDWHIDSYRSIANSITDEFAIGENIESTISHTASAIAFHYIKDDYYSLDSETRSIRHAYDDRALPVLGEVPLDAYALSAPFDIHSFATNYVAPNLESELINNTNWQAINANVSTTGRTVTVTASAGSVGYIYKAIPMIVNDDYFVAAEKITQDGRLLVSVNNAAGGLHFELFSQNSKREYQANQFTASHITMYLVIEVPASKTCTFTDVSLRKIILTS